MSFFVMAGIVWTTGCSNPPIGGMVNGDLTLTADQEAAVDSVVMQIEAVAAAIVGIADSFDGIDADGDTAFGECPMVDVGFVDGVATMTLDFPAGCTNEYYADTSAGGGIVVVFDTATRSFDVTFNDFMTSSGTVTGTMALSLQRDGLSVALAGTVDIDISGVGATTGTITLQIDAETGVMTISEATLTLTSPDDAELAVAIENLVISPIVNGNFTPEVGTLTFEVPNDGPGPDTLTIVVTFDAESPNDGTVSVQVGGGDPVDYQLPR